MDAVGYYSNFNKLVILPMVAGYTTKEKKEGLK
jgi:hypothetical protein